MSHADEKMGKKVGSKFEENSTSISRERVPGLRNGTTQLKSSVGLISCLVNIAKYFLAIMFNFCVVNFGINWILKYFGLALKPLNLAVQAGKRKYSEVDDNEKDPIDDEKENEDENLEKELKRWRPDHVYEAINDFVKKMWGESDMNENIKDGNANDENMNNFPISHNSGKWKQKPDINFVEQKIVGVKSVDEGEGFIRDLTPKKPMLIQEELAAKDTVIPAGDVVNDNLILPGNKAVETSTPLIENETPDVFVFSADKTTNSAASEDIQEDEQSMLSLMTFGEKQVYFNQKIKEEAAAALKSTQRGLNK